MLSKTGCLKEQSFYTGKKAQKATVAKYTKKKYLLPVVKTTPNYILQNKITRGWSIITLGEKKELIMNITGGTFLGIPFGTKVHTDSNKICFKNTIQARQMGFTTYITSYSNLSRAKWKVAENERYERDYWEDYKESLKKEFDFLHF